MTDDVTDGRPEVKHTVLKWDTTDGGVDGAVIVCTLCGGDGGDVDDSSKRCDECSGSGELFRPYHLAQHLESLRAEPSWDFPADLLEAAWGIIANAHGGAWDEASDEWREAAERWRDAWHDTFIPPESEVTEPEREAFRQAIAPMPVSDEEADEGIRDLKAAGWRYDPEDGEA